MKKSACSPCPKFHVRFCFLHQGEPEHPGDKIFSLDSRQLGTRGWKLVIHEKDTVPPFDRTFDIVPGISTSLALSSTKMVRLTKPYFDCVESEKIPETSFRMTRYVCRKMCLADRIEQTCGCVSAEVMPFFRNHFTQKYCLWHNYSNTFQIFEKYNCEAKLRQLFSRGETEDIHNCSFNCKPDCTETEYSFVSSLSEFPTREAVAWFFRRFLYTNPNRDKLLAWKYFVENLKGTDKKAQDYIHKSGHPSNNSIIPENVAAWIRSSFAGVHIYFKDMHTTSVSQVASHTLEELGADIGGCLGLWVGMSVLTVVKFLSRLHTGLW